MPPAVTGSSDCVSPTNARRLLPSVLPQMNRSTSACSCRTTSAGGQINCATKRIFASTITRAMITRWMTVWVFRRAIASLAYTAASCWQRAHTGRARPPAIPGREPGVRDGSEGVWVTDRQAKLKVDLCMVWIPRVIDWDHVHQHALCYPHPLHLLSLNLCSPWLLFVGRLSFIPWIPSIDLLVLQIVGYFSASLSTAQHLDNPKQSCGVHQWKVPSSGSPSA